jgi:hypothetical protein
LLIQGAALCGATLNQEITVQTKEIHIVLGRTLPPGLAAALGIPSTAEAANLAGQTCEQQRPTSGFVGVAGETERFLPTVGQHFYITSFHDNHPLEETALKAVAVDEMAVVADVLGGNGLRALLRKDSYRFTPVGASVLDALRNSEAEPQLG